MPDSMIIYREAFQPFAAACGCKRPLTLAVRRRDNSQPDDVHSFHQPFVRIGRGVNNDLILSDKSVSFRHLYLQFVDGNWACFNLRSTVRTKGQNRQQPVWGWLDEVRELNIGPFVLTQHPDAEDSPGGETAAEPKSLAPAVAGFELELVNRQNQTPRRITRPVTLIGSARHCHLWLKDPSVSTVHASLVLTSRGLWIVDLLGRNGVSVDRRLIRWKQLQNGSFVEIGKFCFRVWLHSAGPQADICQPQPVVESESVVEATAAPFDGNLTREFVMGVLQHLVESRTQFFEHLQYQSQLIHQLVGQLRDAKEANLSAELQRIEQLNQELMDVKRQLGHMAELRPGADIAPPPSPAVSEDLCLPSVAEAEALPSEENAAPPEEPEPNHHAVPYAAPRDLASEPWVSSEGRPFGSIHDVHARLSQRMSKLARQRNSRWLGLLRRLGLSRSE